GHGALDERDEQPLFVQSDDAWAVVCRNGGEPAHRPFELELWRGDDERLRPVELARAPSGRPAVAPRGESDTALYGLRRSQRLFCTQGVERLAEAAIAKVRTGAGIGAVRPSHEQ